MKQDPTLVDLFFGDDFNYVKLPTTGGVSLQAFNTQTTISSTWTFGSTGTITFPDSTVQNTAWPGSTSTLINGNNSITVDGGNGLALNNVQYIYANSTGTSIDIYTGGDNYSEVWLVDNGPVQINTNGETHSWSFNTDGTLTAPGDILPATNKTQSLGSPTQQWKSLYVSTSTIYMNNVPLTIDTTVNQIIVGNQDTGNIVNVASEAYVQQQIATVSRPMAIDGGGSSTLYEIETAYVDGGTASVRHGSQDSVFDGSYGNNYSLNGGGANG
jgi:hypothetical protein